MANKQTGNPRQNQIRVGGYTECSMSLNTINNWRQYRDTHSSCGCIPPLFSLMANCWKMWVVVSEGGRLRLWPWRQSVALIVSTASQLQPPKVSTTSNNFTGEIILIMLEVIQHLLWRIHKWNLYKLIHVLKLATNPSNHSQDIQYKGGHRNPIFDHCGSTLMMVPILA